MDRRALLMGGVGIAAVAALIGAGLFLSRGERVILQGHVQKVRVQAIDEKTTAVILDFRATNPANYASMIGEVRVEIDTNDSKTLIGSAVADIDAERFIAANPLLGPKYNRSLVTHERIPPRQTVDRMIAARFDATEAEINARKKIRIRITDVDGPVSVIE